MGYTHYWNHGSFTDAQWRILTMNAALLIKASRICAGWDGDVHTEIEISNNVISFNGVGEDAHETFALTRAPSEFTFCKTARKPYDAVVVAVLVSAALQADHFEWSSDGDGEADQLTAAQELVQLAIINPHGDFQS